MAFPFGRWVVIDRVPEEPVIAFVYLDPQAGPSAKGGLASEQHFAAMPSRTVRLGPDTRLRELTDPEAHARSLPKAPVWLAHFGPQPATDAPWRDDPHLAGKFSPRFPDDVQALVHDGDPRRTQRDPELCWVRLLQVEQGSRLVYVGELLNEPQRLLSVQRGARIKLLAAAGMPHPLHVTDEYLEERRFWSIVPCDRCGAAECLDPPSVIAHVRFPEAAPDAEISAFSAFCSQCGGIQHLERMASQA